MQANPEFSNQDLAFWANIRAISEAIGYTNRKTKVIYAYGPEHVLKMIAKFQLNTELYFDEQNNPSQLTQNIYDYSKYRAELINNQIAPKLLDKNRAKELFEQLLAQNNPRCPIPMNKQKGDKRTPAYFTAMINILFEKYLKGKTADYNPKELIKIFQAGQLTHTLSRRVDGAYPSVHSPQAIWEIKEYYSTTTFGSRVADGVYETLLDGFELEEVLAANTDLKVSHYLFVDDYKTWWEKGRSYLCRIVDMLHMGKVDEAIFGQEIFEAIPRIVKSWK